MTPRITAIAEQSSDLLDLLRDARAGDGSAFAELYRRFFRMVHAILLSRVAVSDVDDLAQEVFLQAWRQLNSLHDSAAFGGWLRQITIRQVADHFRKQHTTEELHSAAALSSNDEEAWFLLMEIRRLPEAYRDTLVLRFVEGLTGPEIATLTGLTPDSVRVNLHRGTKLLRERLKGAAR